ncbi:MAG: DNA polymerase III subunit delta [Bacteroidota bacterium]
MLFREVIGHHSVKETLRRAVREDRVAHGQLLAGPEGSGGLPLAIAYARYLSCENRGPEEACDTCPSCVTYRKLVHPDLHVIFPVNTTRKVTSHPTSSKFLTEWREALLEQPYQNLFQWLEHIGIENKQGSINVADSAEVLRNLSLTAVESAYRIVIIWLPEKLNMAAGNKLLKIIEEPPARTVFLLVSEDPERILPTIYSRLQLVHLGRIDSGSLAQQLQAAHGLDAGTATSIAHFADGNYLEAQKLVAEDVEVSPHEQAFVQWMRWCYQTDVLHIVPWVDDMAAMGRERQKHFLRYALHVFRECLMLNYGAGELVHVEGSERAFIDKFARFVHGNNILPLQEAFNEAIAHIERNANPKVLFLDLSLKVILLLRKKPVESPAEG